MGDNNKNTDPQFEFEKFKYKVEIIKWFIVSVALVIVTLIIDYGFRDRTAGLQEIQQYDKYVQLVVLNKEVNPRRLLAQYFSNVTASNKLRERWEEYYKVVNSEFNAKLKLDSILQKQLDSLKNQDSLSPTIQSEKLNIKTKIIENQKELTAEIKIPQSMSGNDNGAATDWEKKGFEYLINKDIENSIIAFRNSENSYPAFHQVYEIRIYLENIKDKLKLDIPPEKWREIYKTIIEKYSWKMPPDLYERYIKLSS